MQRTDSSLRAAKIDDNTVGVLRKPKSQHITDILRFEDCEDKQ